MAKQNDVKQTLEDLYKQVYKPSEYAGVDDLFSLEQPTPLEIVPSHASDSSLVEDSAKSPHVLPGWFCLRQPAGQLGKGLLRVKGY